jgi:putative peptidoglycan lipid II flippase
MIAALLAGTDDPVAQARLLALALPVAGVLQLAMLWLACRRAGMTVLPRLDLRDRHLRPLGRRILPGLAGAGIYQVNVVIVTVMATALAPGAVSFLYFADRLAQLPLGLIGVAISTALLPIVARRIAEGRLEEARAVRDQAVEVALLLTLPAAAGLTALALPIVRILFERGAFDAMDAAGTATALQAFALGLPAAVLVRVLAASLFARGDMRTPLLGASVALLVTVAVGVATLETLGHLGLAVAASLASWANLAVLAWRLGAVEGRAFSRRTKLRTAGAFACATVAASLAHQAFTELRHVGDATALASAILVAALAFLAMVTVARVARPQELAALFRDRA